MQNNHKLTKKGRVGKVGRVKVTTLVQLKKRKYFFFLEKKNSRKYLWSIQKTPSLPSLPSLFLLIYDYFARIISDFIIPLHGNVKTHPIYTALPHLLHALFNPPCIRIFQFIYALNPRKVKGWF